MFRSQANRPWWRRGLAAIVTALGLLPVAAPAAERPTDPLARHILAGRWNEAEEELARVRGRLDVDPLEVLFLTGMLAQGQKQYDRAVDAFRRILDQQPGLVRVRLELGRTLFDLRDDEAAKFHFERALSGGLPEPVQVNVQRYLAQIRARRNWTLEGGVGLLPDSNINTGTNQQFVEIGGLPFTLSTEAREKSGVGFQLSVQGTKSFRLAEAWQLRAFASALRRDYPDSRFDDMIVRAGVGPRRLFQRGEFGIAPFYSERRFGNDILNRADGIRADGVWQLSARYIGEGAFEYQRFTYPGIPDRDGGVTWAFLGVRYLATPSTQFLVGLDYYRDEARDPMFRNEATGWTLGWFRDWAHAVSTGVTVRVAETQYEGLQGLFGEYRNDRFTTVTTNITKRDWSFNEFVPTLSVSFFDNDSSIPFFGFTRRQGLIAVNRRL